MPPRTLEPALLGTMKLFLLKNPPFAGWCGQHPESEGWETCQPHSQHLSVSLCCSPPSQSSVSPPQPGKGSRVNPPGRAARSEGLSHAGLLPACLFPNLRVLFNTEQAPGLQRPRRHGKATGWKPAPGKQVPGARETWGFYLLQLGSGGGDK